MQDPKRSFTQAGNCRGGHGPSAGLVAESWTQPCERLGTWGRSVLFCGSSEEMFAACAAEHGEYLGAQQSPRRC